MENVQTETKTYQIGGRTFTALPMVARQEKWLWPHIKTLFQKGEGITTDDIFSLMTDSLTRIAAILLIQEGQTQVQKVRAGMAGVEQLEAWMEETVSVSELGPVVADFFSSGQQWKILQGLAGPLHRATTGLTKPYAPSQTETSSEPNGSGHTSALVTVDSRCNADGSAAPSSEPSLVSAG